MRVAGVDLPRYERIEVGLTRIFGIGRSSARRIIRDLGLDPNKKVRDVTDEEGMKIRAKIDNEYKIEGDKRREIAMNIKRLQDIGCYRGLRHRMGLPVRGQRTRTNARTRKGPRKSVGGVKKKGV